MLKTNLLPKPPPRAVYLQSVGWWLLLIITACHLTGLGWSWLFAYRAKEQATAVQARLHTLETKRDALSIAPDLTGLAGAVTARTAWFQDRGGSPLALLARVQNRRPPAGRLEGFDAGTSGGMIKAVGPDIEALSGWLNHALGTVEGKLTVDERREGMLKASFTWNK